MNEAAWHISPTDVFFYTDSLTEGHPYIAERPRTHYSLVFFTEGAVSYRLDDTETIFESGQILFIRKGTHEVSSAYQCPRVSYIAVNFLLGGGDDCAADLPFAARCSDGRTFGYEKLFFEAMRAFVSRSPGYLAVCEGILTQIIGYLYHEYAVDSDIRRKAMQLAPALAYIGDCGAAVTVGGMARAAYMSEKQFRRVFAAVYGCTPHVFLQRTRIDKAAALLCGTEKSVTEIALRCGFADVYSFSRCFSKHMGQPPTAYRAER